TATGRYLRLADGTQFCWHQMGLGSVAAQGSGTWAAPYRTAAASWTFPMPFAAPPAVTAQALLASTLTAARRMVQAQVGSDITATAAPGILAIRIGGDATADTPTVVLTAAGRWF